MGAAQEFAREAPGLGPLHCHPDELGQERRREEHVGVQEHEVGRGGLAYRNVGRPCVADVLGRFDQADVREPLPDRSGRSVGRSVIDDDDLRGRMRLGANALETVRQESASVEVDDDDAHGRETKKRRLAALRRIREKRRAGKITFRCQQGALTDPGTRCKVRRWPTRCQFR
jgi:hypothetical protein